MSEINVLIKDFFIRDKINIHGIHSSTRQLINEKIKNNYKNCHIDISKHLDIFGFVDDVKQAKNDLVLILNKKLDQKMNESLDFMWQFQSKTGKKEWTNFSIALNFSIEENFNEKKKLVRNFSKLPYSHTIFK